MNLKSLLYGDSSRYPTAEVLRKKLPRYILQLTIFFSGKSRHALRQRWPAAGTTPSAAAAAAAAAPTIPNLLRSSNEVIMQVLILIFLLPRQPAQLDQAVNQLTPG